MGCNVPTAMDRERDDQCLPYEWFVGVDWGSQRHQVCVLDCDRRLVGERAVDHDGASLARLADWLWTLSVGQPQRVAVAIEVPRGAIVEGLVERGFHLFALNPKQLDRFRDRHTVAAAKDDRRDAFVPADSLRTDPPCFRQVRVGDPLVIQLREMSRVDDDLAEDMNRLTNRLREQLHRFYAALPGLSPSADEPWLCALLELAPTPAAGARLKPKQIQKLLDEHRIRRLDAQAVRAALAEAPLHVAPGATEAATAH